MPVSKPKMLENQKCNFNLYLGNYTESKNKSLINLVQCEYLYIRPSSVNVEKLRLNTGKKVKERKCKDIYKLFK